MKNQGKRLTILSDAEIDDIYGLPKFTDEQKTWHFSLNEEENRILETLKLTSTKVYFILQLGYFKAKKVFFDISFQSVRNDVGYIIQKYFPKQKFPRKMVSKNIQSKLRQKVLGLLDYKLYKNELRQQLEDKLSKVVTIGIETTYVIRELLNYLDHQRISIPSYSALQRIISSSLQKEQYRLNRIISDKITPQINSAISRLLTIDNALYEITALKKKPKDFSHKEVMGEVKKYEENKELYSFVKALLPKLKISRQNIRYYASLAEYYTVYKLRRMKPQTTKLYLLCFVYYRFQQVNDNLATCFFYYLKKYKDEADNYAKEKIYEYKVEGNNNLKNVTKILDLLADKDIPKKTTFEIIQKKAFSILAEEKFPIVKKYISGVGFDKNHFEWDYYSEINATFKKNLRPLFRSISFQIGSDSSLLKAIQFLEQVFSEGKNLKAISSSKFPISVIPKQTRGYLLDNGKINSDKYEFFVYQMIGNQFDLGKVSCKDTTKFKSLKDDLVDDERWKQKNKIIKNLVMPKLEVPIDKLLKSLEIKLERRLLQVNERIVNGHNADVKIQNSENGYVKWSLPYKKQEDDINNPFYSNLPQINIIQILKFVDAKSEFTKAFSHIQTKYAKKHSDHTYIKACIIANGTNLGIYKMADISNLKLQILSSTEKNFLRIETLRKANDIISNAISKCPVFKHWDIGDRIHASADGQKFETRRSTLKSRYSSKYFGLNKGVVPYSMVANHVPINAKVIGANEHESYYVFDIVYNNTSEISPDFLSHDMHGNNPINFSLLDFIGCQYAPRYTKITHKANMIYGFQNLNKYQNLLIKPHKKINSNLIKEDWDNIQRIMVSLGLKETTQSTIVKKLCSSNRNSKTKNALWEYDKILMSLYVLDFIDDANIRKNVQRALNRGESYHQLRRAVAIANGGRFRGNTEVEIEIWNECSRLIANSIIFYNAYMLSLLLERTEYAGLHDEASFIKRLSPVAWQHINLFGWYDFSEDDETVKIEKFIEILDKNLK